jgi:hypothetical protein
MLTATTLLNLADDAVFALLDVSGGYKTMEEAGFEFGKKALISGVSAAIGGVFNGVEGLYEGFTPLLASNAGGLGKTVVQTTMAGFQTFAASISTSALNAVNYNSKDGWSYSGGAFSAGLGGLSGQMLTSMTGTAAAGVLGAINSGTGKDGINVLTGFSTVNFKNVERLYKLLGGLAGEGVNYAFTGDFNLNVLNAGLFTSKDVNKGLLEMRLGNNGFRMNIGTGGVNISPDELYSAAGGALVWGINTGIDIFAMKNDFDAKVALRAQYGYGDDAQKKQLWNILSGRDALLAGGNSQNTGDPYTAETNYINGKRTVHLGGYDSSMSAAEQMYLGVVLGHEAWRDGLVTGDNERETQSAVLAHTKMAAAMLEDGQALRFTENLANDLIAYYSSGGGGDGFNKYVNANYDSSGDYWLLKKDGSIVDDDSADLRWEAVTKDGGARYKTIWRAGKGVTKEESLITLLGGSEKAQQLLADQGIPFTGKETAGELGSLIMAGFTNSPENGGALNLDYSRFNFEKDWLAIYKSYSAGNNAAFFRANTWYAGRADLLKAANIGESITDPLEYYALLFDPLKKALPLAGTEYENDPLGYLQNNTSIVTYPGAGSVRVRNDMKEGLLAAYETAKAQGGVIPKSAGGLMIRFMNNDGNKLYLSDHATGYAVDFDPGNNGQYFIPEYAKTNSDFNKYLSEAMGVSQKEVKGWAKNQQMAQLYSKYEAYLTSNKNILGALLNVSTDQTIVGSPAVFTSTLARIKQDYFLFEKLLGEVSGIPKLEFNMGEEFVNNMLTYFEWGGDWWPQKDYMHFQKRK